MGASAYGNSTDGALGGVSTSVAEQDATVRPTMIASARFADGIHRTCTMRGSSAIVVVSGETAFSQQRSVNLRSSPHPFRRPQWWWDRSPTLAKGGATGFIPNLAQSRWPNVGDVPRGLWRGAALAQTPSAPVETRKRLWKRLAPWVSPVATDTKGYESWRAASTRSC